MTPEWAFILRVALISLVILGLEQSFSRRARVRRNVRRSAPQVIDLSAFRAPPAQLQRANINAVQTGTTQPTTTIVRLEPFAYESAQKSDYVTEKRAA